MELYREKCWFLSQCGNNASTFLATGSPSITRMCFLRRIVFPVRKVRKKYRIQVIPSLSNIPASTIESYAIDFWSVDFTLVRCVGNAILRLIVSVTPDCSWS